MTVQVACVCGLLSFPLAPHCVLVPVDGFMGCGRRVDKVVRVTGGTVPVTSSTQASETRPVWSICDGAG